MRSQNTGCLLPTLKFLGWAGITGWLLSHSLAYVEALAYATRAAARSNGYSPIFADLIMLGGGGLVLVIVPTLTYLPFYYLRNRKKVPHVP
ncbi:hypothetical protein LUCX_270 [Xanthomonas phage vB_XciM_LucasX]|nr:hypothetical protein LUCX_270 [Xanthomonas phage vB_XciM_LucasX]